MAKIDFVQPEHLLDAYHHRFNRTVHSIGSELLPFFGAEYDRGFPTDHVLKRLQEITLPVLSEQAKKARLVVLSAGSGTGKTAVGKALEQHGMKKLKRTTTRPKRPNESFDDYDFVTFQEFNHLHNQGYFAHVKPTYGDMRGIPHTQLLETLNSERMMFAEGDALAYADIIKWYEEFRDLQYLGIYLLPPNSTQYTEQVSQAAAKHFSVYKLSQRLDSSIHYLEKSRAHIMNGVYHGYLVNHNPQQTAQTIIDLFSS